MKRNRLALTGFAVMALLQLAVPAWMIVDREWTLRHGQAFKFRTRPVDPVDAFRGRYVWVSLDPATVKVTEANAWHYGQKVFAVLATDPDGFASVDRLDRVRPEGLSALPVHIRHVDVQSGELRIDWEGLDRFYMNEAKAPDAESAYRQHSRTNNPSCHAVVRVRGARGVMENLFIEDQPIQDWLRARQP